MRIAVVGVGLAALVLTAGPRPTAAVAQDPERWPRGVIVDSVACREAPAETYALYLPSDYAPDRVWPVLLAFHPAARGRAFVELYEAAAERYGYVIAASNTSRNGPWERSARAVSAMSRDLAARFAIDADRVYLTGHSGGARLAMAVALGTDRIAGVVASSAGFADARPRARVGFAVYATAGIDDFNYVEMRRLDEALRTPHHLAIVPGGHALPSPAVAREALEWLELQAMRSGHRARDGALVEAWYATRVTAAEAETDPVTALRLWRSIVADFEDLRDVAADRARVSALERQTDLKTAVARDRTALALEQRALEDALRLESRLRDPEAHDATLGRLDDLLAGWARAATAAASSPERSRARRLLSGLGAGAAERVEDDAYAALLQKYRWRP